MSAEVPTCSRSNLLSSNLLPSCSAELSSTEPTSAQGTDFWLQGPYRRDDALFFVKVERARGWWFMVYGLWFLVVNAVRRGAFFYSHVCQAVAVCISAKIEILTACTLATFFFAGSPPTCQLNNHHLCRGIRSSRCCDLPGPSLSKSNQWGFFSLNT